MIRCTNITKSFPGFRLKPLSFELPDGYLCGLAGKNGSGKTTLLHLLLGLYHTEAGELSFDGKTYDKSEKEIKDSIGTVLTDELLNKGLSLEKNGDCYGRFFSGYKKEQYLEFLRMFQLDRRKKFAELSKGEKLKCQFAFALSCSPKYLFLDEPAANFDPEFRELFMKLIKDFVNDGKKSVILATHLTEDLDRLADYLIFMEEGESIYAGDIETFRERYRILSGEAYKLKLFDPKLVLAMEEKTYGAKALIRHHNYNHYDSSLKVSYSSIAEFMYYRSKMKKPENSLR